MDRIGQPYLDCYFLDENRVYNSNTKRYLRSNNNQFKLLGADGKRHNVSLKDLYFKVYNRVYCKDTIPDLESEIWKPIDNSCGNYFISNMGRIKSYKGYAAKLLKAIKTDKGYMRVSADFGSGATSVFVHRLVAEYFLPLPNKPFCEVHHKDFNSYNNRADNLIWVTRQEHTEIHNKHDRRQTA